MSDVPSFRLHHADSRGRSERPAASSRLESPAAAGSSPTPAAHSGSARPLPASRTDPAKPDDFVVAVGTRIPLSMINSISTKTAAEGERVYLETVFPILVNAPCRDSPRKLRFRDRHGSEASRPREGPR